MSIRCRFSIICLMAGGAMAGELRKADFTGTWEATFVSGEEGQDLSRFTMDLKADGTMKAKGRPEVRSWYYAKTEEGLQLLLLDEGGEEFFTMIVDIKDGEMTWAPFHRDQPLEALKPGGKVAYRFKKLPRK